MTLTIDFPRRMSSHGPMSSTCLEDKFEIIKDIGDGSFGSVALARVRTAGAHIARRGTMVRSVMLRVIASANGSIGCHQDNEKDFRRHRAVP